MRHPEIDFLRGIAILMMVVFHFTFSLNYFNVININMLVGFWKVFQVLTGGLFIFLVGLSLTLSYSNTKKDLYPLKYIMRGARIFGYGLIITIGSLFFMKESFVFFGILHFIGISIIIATPFIRFSYLNLLLGLLTFTAGFYLQQFALGFPWLVWVWLNYPVKTLDIYAILPWISIVFFGLFIGNLIYPKGKSRFKLKNILRPVQFLGKNSLLMYFIHLPVVFVLAWVVSLV